MSRQTIKHVAILTLILYAMNLIFPLLPASVMTYSVQASNIDNNDVYKGLGIALILIMLAKIGKANEPSTNNIIDEIDFNDIPDNDIEILARVIHAEARGEPYDGQVAVGAVVLNRVKSPEFPNTIRGVVYQSGQFSSVDDGQIHLQPNSTSYKAARDALQGKDPSLGAIFFYNPRTARTISWLSQRKTTITIGNHVFAK